MYRVFTSSEDYKRVTLTYHSPHFTFWLRTCSEARIAISYEYGVMGNNRTVLVTLDPKSDTTTMRVIGESRQVTSYMPLYLTCDTYRQFWMHVSSTFVRIGVGDIWKNIFFLTFTKLTFPNGHQSLAMTTVGQGEWIISKHDGRFNIYLLIIYETRHEVVLKCDL